MPGFLSKDTKLNANVSLTVLTSARIHELGSWLRRTLRKGKWWFCHLI